MPRSFPTPCAGHRCWDPLADPPFSRWKAELSTFMLCIRPLSAIECVAVVPGCYLLCWGHSTYLCERQVTWSLTSNVTCRFLLKSFLFASSSMSESISLCEAWKGFRDHPIECVWHGDCRQSVAATLILIICQFLHFVPPPKTGLGAGVAYSDLVRGGNDLNARNIESFEPKLGAYYASGTTVYSSPHFTSFWGCHSPAHGFVQFLLFPLSCSLVLDSIFFLCHG